RDAGRGPRQPARPGGRVPGAGRSMRAAWIVYRKEIVEILRDRRTLMAIGLSALATPIVLTVISQGSTQTATQAYTVGYSGQVPPGLDILLTSTGLKLNAVDDPAAAANQQADLGAAFQAPQLDACYHPPRQSRRTAA